MQNTISVKNIIKRYGDKTVLNRVSFRLGRGQVLGVLGLNGAGKTTLINSLGGLVPVDRGEIYYLGKKYQQDQIDLKGQIGILTDRPGLYEELRGQEYLYLIARLYGLSKETAKVRTAELLHFMGLTDMKSQFIHHYSTGMKKKLAVAAVLIYKPQILLLDEPFENIDPVSRESFIKVFKRMASGGASIVLTAHILSNIEEICNQICIIRDGSILISDTIVVVKKFLLNQLESKSQTSLENMFVELMRNENAEKKLTFI